MNFNPAGIHIFQKYKSLHFVITVNFSMVQNREYQEASNKRVDYTYRLKLRA